MITIKCELYNKDLYKVIDDAFVTFAGMNKISEGYYESDDKDVFNTSFLAVDDLLKIKGFIESVKSLTRNVDGEEEDIFEYYNYLKSKNKI